MIRRFPRQQPFLERTRLRYVHFLHLLTDGKRERASRVPGFVAVFLGHETDLILLLAGEPANALNIRPGKRSVVPIAAVVERATQETERGDVAFYGAPEAQLCAMFSTVAHPPLDLPDLDGKHPGRLFARLEEERFDGVLEVLEGDAVHYVLLEGGTPREAFIAEETGGGDLADRLERLFAPERAPGLEVKAYPPVRSLPVQAAPALVQLYARTISGALEALREPLGAEAVRLFEEARTRAAEKHAALASYCVGPEGGVTGESVAEAEALTDAVAAWLLEALTAASRIAEGIDPAALLERVTYENRFALEAQGFFRHLPWPVGR